MTTSRSSGSKSVGQEEESISGSGSSEKIRSWYVVVMTSMTHEIPNVNEASDSK